MPRTVRITVGFSGVGSILRRIRVIRRSMARSNGSRLRGWRSRAASRATADDRGSRQRFSGCRTRPRSPPCRCRSGRWQAAERAGSDPCPKGCISAGSVPVGPRPRSPGSDDRETLPCSSLLRSSAPCRSLDWHSPKTGPRRHRLTGRLVHSRVRSISESETLAPLQRVHAYAVRCLARGSGSACPRPVLSSRRLLPEPLPLERRPGLAPEDCARRPGVDVYSAGGTNI